MLPTATRRQVANPHYAARLHRPRQPQDARRFRDRGDDAPPPRAHTITLPQAPRNASPVPWLTSIHSTERRGPWGHSSYPGNCDGHIIKDLLQFFRPRHVLDPMTGSGTCRDVCRDLAIPCDSFDLVAGRDATDPASYRGIEAADFCWLHPPYWRQKLYTRDARCLSRTATLQAFLDRYRSLIAACTDALAPGGRIAILMGDYSDREAGFVPLVYHTKQLAFDLGLRQCCTDIIRLSHGASSSRKVYRSAFIPGLHDVCMVFQKPAASSQAHVSIDRIGKIRHHTFATHGQGGHL